MKVILEIQTMGRFDERFENEFGVEELRIRTLTVVVFEDRNTDNSFI